MHHTVWKDILIHPQGLINDVRTAMHSLSQDGMSYAVYHILSTVEIIEGEEGGEDRGAGRDEINGLAELKEGVGEDLPRGGGEADLSKPSVTLMSRTRFCFHYL